MDNPNKHDTPKLCSVAEGNEGKHARLIVSCSCGNTKQYRGKDLRYFYFVCDGSEIATRTRKEGGTRIELPYV